MFPQQPAPHQPQFQPSFEPQPQPQPQPLPMPVPQPVPQQAVPAVGGPQPVAGYEPTGWGPPVTVPVGYPPPPPPLPVPGRLTFRILVAVVIVLVAATAVTAVLGWSDVSHLRHGVSSRQAEQDRITQQEQAAVRKQVDDFRGAGLDALLQRVKDQDKAADAAFRSWRDGTARFGVLDTAMNDCDDAVIAYNSAAGPFPDHLFTVLPRRINLDNPETDCGRAFTAGI